MKINDWVYSYSKGIWQIIKMLKVDLSFPDKSTKTDVFVKRIINEKGKRSFSIESVHPSFIKPITSNDNELLETFIKENPKVFKEFNSYYKPIDYILNLSFYVKDIDEKNQFKDFAEETFKDIKNGLYDFQILEILEEKRKDRRSSIRNITLQFVALDSEVYENRYLYTQMNILDF